MKKINIVFISIFFLALLLPVLFFNFKADVTSEIDNRKLTNNPLIDKTVIDEKGSLTDALDDYVSDRVGFRNFFIRSYTWLNDIAFNKMIHPIYEYGEDGYVFFVAQTGNKQDYDEFFDDFIKMISKINKYCQERNVPFIFAFEPSKSSVMTDKINKGINYDNSWLNAFFERIESEGIEFVNNYDLLKEKYESGEKVFNQKYDAGHWNDLGAFYGVNNILESMKKHFGKLHVGVLDDFSISNVVYDTLSVSEYSINEEGLSFSAKEDGVKDVTDVYSGEIKINNQHPYYKYWINSKNIGKSPKTLVFQGSYMNSYGYKFFLNSLSEYIAVHNYENILDFDYYFNLFKPECVVFEVTEYALSGKYFNKEIMKSFDLNPSYSNFKNYSVTNKKLNKTQLSIEKGKSITTIRVNNLPQNIDYSYIKINNIMYDLTKDNNAYTVSIPTNNYNNIIVVSTVNANNHKIINYK